MAFRPAHERKPPALSGRRLLFVDHYIVCWNALAAAKKAGYRRPETESAALLKDPRIIARIKETQLAVLERVTVDKQRVVEELACLGFANMADFVEEDANGLPRFKAFSKLSRQRTAAVKKLTIRQFAEQRDAKGWLKAPASVEIKMELHSKDPSLLRLGQHLGLFPKDGAITPFEANGETKEDVAAELLSRFAGIARRLNLPVFAAPPDVIEIEADKPKEDVPHEG